ncbi:MAG TPA: hypothetical protein VHG91_18105 [Longimicrobium sp.]|nr:hypothetical protein [Longimicrobium sp.]
MRATLARAALGLALAAAPPAHGQGPVPNPAAATIEDLGTFTTSATPEQRYLVRLPSGEVHALLYYTLPDYATTPVQIVDVNLATGAARTVRGVPGRPGPNATLLHSSGTLFLGTGEPGWLMSYDFATGRADTLGPLADAQAQSMVEGADGAVYIGESTHATVQRYDPATRALTSLGVASDTGAYRLRYAYTLGADSGWVYVASGQFPWYLATRPLDGPARWRFSLRSPAPSFLEVVRMRDGLFARAETGSAARWYALRGGEAVPMDTAPAPAPAGPVCPMVAAPAQKACQEEMEVVLDLAGAVPLDPSGNVTVRWRGRGDTAWRRASAPLRREPYPIRWLFGAPGRGLVGFGAFYGPVFTYDPASGRGATRGLPFVSVYHALPWRGSWFFAGYPEAVMRWDTAGAWTLTSAPFGADTVGLDPRLVTPIAGDSSKYYYFGAWGADSVLYLGGHHERGSVGGSLAWYDPATGTSGELRAPFLDDDVDGLLALAGGTRLVYSSFRVSGGGDGRLFLFDTRTRDTVRSFAPLPGSAHAGSIVEVRPGVVMGMVGDSVHPRQVYVADVAAGRVLFRAPLAVRDRPWTPPRFPQLGPDGWVWMTDGDTIVRVDPADGSVERVMSAGAPSGLLWAGDDLYLYGGPTLRRVVGLFGAPGGR